MCNVYIYRVVGLALTGGGGAARPLLLPTYCRSEFVCSSRAARGRVGRAGAGEGRDQYCPVFYGFPKMQDQIIFRFQAFKWLKKISYL